MLVIRLSDMKCVLPRVVTTTAVLSPRQRTSTASSSQRAMTTVLLAESAISLETSDIGENGPQVVTRASNSQSSVQGGSEAAGVGAAALRVAWSE